MNQAQTQLAAAAAIAAAAGAGVDGVNVVAQSAADATAGAPIPLPAPSAKLLALPGGLPLRRMVCTSQILSFLPNFIVLPLVLLRLNLCPLCCLAREQFALAVARTKAVLNPPLVILLMLYPSVIAFTLAMRYTKYSLLIPTPNAPNAAPPSPQLDHDPRNEWHTTAGEALACMVISFTVVTLIHCLLLTYMTLKGPRD
ncbi:unnamed protein product [Urochloa humidicola]